jgi:hypothetical protein
MVLISSAYNFFYLEDEDSSETSVPVYPAMQGHIPEDHNCNIQRCENFTSHIRESLPLLAIKLGLYTTTH